MFVAFEEFQKLDDTRMVDAAHDLDFLENIGTLMIKSACVTRELTITRSNGGTTKSLLVYTKALSMLEGQHSQVQQ